MTDADIVLVGCVSQKHARPMAAKDLYRSPLFRKRRAYAEASGQPWAILSALHGLVDPDADLAPYDVRLSELSRLEQSEWGLWTTSQLVGRFGSLTGLTLEFHAGESYVRALQPPLEEQGAQILRPLQGLSIGRQLQWYNAR